MGWIGLATCIHLRIAYVSEHDFGDYFPGEGVIAVLESWLVAGVVMVVLDTFRRKTDTELGFWAIAFGVSVLTRAADFLMRTSDAFWPGETGSLVIDVISLLIWLPAVLIWLVTMFFGTLTYTVYFTRRAVSSWRAYIRST